MPYFEGRYEFVGVSDGGNESSKFWEIRELEDGTFEASFGRIGKRPQNIIYGYREAEKKATEKIRKGYVKVGDKAKTKQTLAKRLIAPVQEKNRLSKVMD